jgi:hypothetical protein
MFLGWRWENSRERIRGVNESLVKVKESRNRPGVVHRVPGSLGSHIS